MQSPDDKRKADQLAAIFPSQSPPPKQAKLQFKKLAQEEIELKTKIENMDYQTQKAKAEASHNHMDMLRTSQTPGPIRQPTWCVVGLFAVARCAEWRGASTFAQALGCLARLLISDSLRTCARRCLCWCAAGRSAAGWPHLSVGVLCNIALSGRSTTHG